MTDAVLDKLETSRELACAGSTRERA
jgi:hypothetical protein